MYPGKAGHIKLALVGDVMLAKSLPKKLKPDAKLLSDLLYSHDCTIGNLETTIHDGEGIPEAYPGGGWAMASRYTLKDLERFGLMMYACANNHSMDYGQSGLLCTIRNLKSYNIPFAGIGENLSEAAVPAYYDCENGRISLISVTSSFHDSYLAGPQNQDMRGRPGINPLRHSAVYELDAADYQALIHIAEKTGINSYHSQAIKEGYLLQKTGFNFGNRSFVSGTTGLTYTSPLKSDLQRTINGIKDARNMSDIVIISLHGHQFGNDKETPPQFHEIFCKKCIEAGADIVFCHGPHLLRGIEKHQSGIIFYGLGNFILQQDQMKALPEEYYWKYSTTRQNCYGVSEAYNIQSANNTRGLNADPRSWESIVVSIDWNTSKKIATLYPVKLDRYGIPSLQENDSILQKVQCLSSKYSTEIKINNGFGRIEWGGVNC